MLYGYLKKRHRFIYKFIIFFHRHYIFERGNIAMIFIMPQWSCLNIEIVFYSF